MPPLFTRSRILTARGYFSDWIEGPCYIRIWRRGLWARRCLFVSCRLRFQGWRALGGQAGSGGASVIEEESVIAFAGNRHGRQGHDDAGLLSTMVAASLMRSQAQRVEAGRGRHGNALDRPARSVPPRARCRRHRIKLRRNLNWRWLFCEHDRPSAARMRLSRLMWFLGLGRAK